MKGVIPMCLERMVINGFGKDKWSEILKEAGLKEGILFLAGQDIKDKALVEMFDSG